MTFSRKKVIAALKDMAVIVGFLLAAVLLTLFEQVMRKDYGKSETYVYVPTGQTDISALKKTRSFNCSWCHRQNDLSRHRIAIQSEIFGKDMSTNLFVLCRNCNFVLGHRCNWKMLNPDVAEIVNTYTNCLEKH